MAIVTYTCLGLPLLLCWLLVNGKTLAQVWLLICSNVKHACLKNRLVQPQKKNSNEGCDVDEHPKLPSSLTFERPDSRVRVISVATPKGGSITLQHRDVFVGCLALCFVLLLYIIFGAGAMAAQKGRVTTERRTMLDSIFWIFLQLMAVTADPLLSSGAEARVFWVLYFAGGMVLQTTVAYLVYLLLTWRCPFCRVP